MMMAIHTLRREQVVDAPPDAVFAFFADPLQPRGDHAAAAALRGRDARRRSRWASATFIQYRLRVHGVPVRWDTLIQAWEPPRRFVDVQVRGPYRLWHHTHELSALDDGRTLMRDTVRYALGFGALGALAHRLIVRRDLEAIFAYRAQRVPQLLS